MNKGFVNIFATTPNSYSKGDKVKIKQITGIDTREYEGKTYITVFAEVEELENSNNYEGLSPDELPF